MAGQAEVTPEARATLHDFCRHELFHELHAALWPDGGPVVAPGAEPPALLALIETLTPDDGWLTPSSKKGDPDALHVNDANGDAEGEGEDVDDGPATIRYINPQAHPALAVLQLSVEAHERGDNTTFIVRHEYGLFMQHAMSCVSKPVDDSFRARFFVTGQSGIGTSFACYYFLLRLLALGQSVFFLNSRTSVYYFSSDGVQKNVSIDGPQPWPDTVQAIRKSWVLIDIDDNSEWSCPQIFRHARCVIWTSSPQESRMKTFIKRFGAEKWYMKAWSSKEIAAVTERFAIDRDKILNRLDTGGPVARTLFGGVPVPSVQSIEDAINTALARNIFAFPAVHGLFLIQPLVVIDRISGRACLQRTDCSAEFVSAHIAQRTFDLAQRQLEKVQGDLAAALDISTTRSVAGKVVEGLMHHALTRGMALPKTRPFESPPPVWDRRFRNKPRYGLGWKSTIRDVYQRNKGACFADALSKIVAPRWLKYMDTFIDKIDFDPQFVYEIWKGDGEVYIYSLATFNDNAKSLASLSGPDGRAFVEAAKEAMQIPPEEEATLQWYRCSVMK